MAPLASRASADTVDAVARALSNVDTFVFPLPCLRELNPTVSTSRRVQTRWRRKVRYRNAYNATVIALNGLWQGPSKLQGRQSSVKGSGANPSVERVRTSSTSRDIESRFSALYRSLSKDTCTAAGRRSPRGRLCGEQLHALLGKSDASYERSSDVVKMTVERVQGIDEPSCEACYDIMQIPEIQTALQPDNLFRDDLGEPATKLECAEVDARSSTFGGTRAAYGSYLRKVRSNNFWAFGKVEQTCCINGVFFVKKKKAGRYRKIISAVPANTRCVGPPTVNLPGSWVLSRLHVKGDVLYIGDIDISNYYTRLRLPKNLWSLFGAPLIPARFVASEQEKVSGRVVCPLTGNTFGLSEVIVPWYTRVPMGWSWGVWVALRVVESELERCLRSDAALLRVDPPRSGRSEEAPGRGRCSDSGITACDATLLPAAGPGGIVGVGEGAKGGAGCHAPEEEAAPRAGFSAEAVPAPPSAPSSAAMSGGGEGSPGVAALVPSYDTLNKGGSGKVLSLNLPARDRGAIVLHTPDVAYGAFIDNIIIAGCEKERVERFLDVAHAHLDSVNLTIGDRNEVALSQTELGLVIDGSKKVLRSAQACGTLRGALLYLAECRRHHGKCLQRVLGHLAWILPLKRILFSILGSCYHFVDVVGYRWGTAWGSVQKELRTVANLLWFCFADLAPRAAPIVLATDAEGASFGGVPYAPTATLGGGAAVIAPISADETNSLVGVYPNPAGGTPTDLAHLETFIQDKACSSGWYVLYNQRWIYREPIHLGELSAVLLAVQRLVKSGVARGCKILVFTDSSVVYFALRKGRSSRYSLRRRLQSLAAWLLVGDVTMDVRWCPSGAQPADFASRSQGLLLEDADRCAIERAHKDNDFKELFRRIYKVRNLGT